jgi:hypothetical protein
MTTDSVPAATGGLSRRQLLLGGAGAIVAAGVGLSLTAPGRSLFDALPFVGDARRPLDRTPMAERLGERFATHDADGNRVVLTLAAVEDLPARSQTYNVEGQFVARFQGPRDAPLSQNTYRFSTETFGEVDVFVVPGAIGDETAIDYSATFNRMFTEVTP